METEIKNIDIESLIPYVRNARTHSDRQVAQIAASIKEFGWTNPILTDGNKGIIAGHGRLLAARKLGMDKVPVIELSHLSNIQKRAYIIADNKLAIEAGWDEELLGVELEELEGAGFDLTLTGFDGTELDGLIKKESEGLTDEDEVPETPEKPVSKLGDIWILGNHRLMCGDSTDIKQVELLMDGQKADMVFTDPPYGVDYDGGHAVKGKRREKLVNDKTPDIYKIVLPVIHCFSRQGAAVYLWYADTKSLEVFSAVLENGYEIRNMLIWNKNIAQFGAIGAQYKSKHESFLYCFKKGHSPLWNGVNNEVSVWDVDRSSKNEYHPTQKPVELGSRAIGNSSKSGDIIFDLFSGSGSTLIACEKTNRISFGSELDPKYCDVIINRWQDYTGQEAKLNNKTYEEVRHERLNS